MDISALETLLDDGASQARGPILALAVGQLAVAVGGDVKGVLERDVELDVGKAGFAEGEVGVCGPRVVGQVEDERGVVGGIAAEEGRAGSGVAVDEGARVGDFGEG